MVESSNLGEVAIRRIATSPRFELSTTATVLLIVAALNKIRDYILRTKQGITKDK